MTLFLCRCMHLHLFMDIYGYDHYSYHYCYWYNQHYYFMEQEEFARSVCLSVWLSFCISICVCLFLSLQMTMCCLTLVNTSVLILIFPKFPKIRSHTLWDRIGLNHLIHNSCRLQGFTDRLYLSYNRPEKILACLLNVNGFALNFAGPI